jgi:methylated-DNA-[protein]-cysteine S-methyltransferase
MLRSGMTGFAIFVTAIGPCGVAWGERGIVGVQLPQANAAATKARLRRRFPALQEAASPPVAGAIARMTALLAGARVDFSDVEIDCRDIGPWEQAVYAVASGIPIGETLTYGEVATRLGDAAQARAVGQALGRNPVPIIVPCHRVVAAGGKSGGFSAPGGVATKLRILAIESGHTPLPLFAGRPSGR